MQFRQNFRSAIRRCNRHEQGFALQTLIVTAVLVLLAVGAGVVVIAITRSSSDDLEGAQGDLESRCQPWEIFDPELAAVGAGGGAKASIQAAIMQDFSTTLTPNSVPLSWQGSGGVTSSAIGCLAPCYLTLNDHFDASLDLALKNDETHLNQPPYSGALAIFGTPEVRGPSPGDLKFDTSNRPTKYVKQASSVATEVRIGVASEMFITQAGTEAERIARRYDTLRLHYPHDDTMPYEFTTSNTGWSREFEGFDPEDSGIIYSGVAVGLHDPPVAKDTNIAIRVSTDQSACEIYHTITGEILLSSRNT